MSSWCICFSQRLISSWAVAPMHYISHRARSRWVHTVIVHVFAAKFSSRKTACTDSTKRPRAWFRMTSRYYCCVILLLRNFCSYFSKPVSCYQEASCIGALCLSIKIRLLSDIVDHITGWWRDDVIRRMVAATTMCGPLRASCDTSATNPVSIR